MRQTATGPQQTRTGDPALDLLAAIVRRAIEDASKGSAAAKAWLMTFILNGQIGWTMGTETNERHVRNYDNSEVWHVDAYDQRSATILNRLGATVANRGYDGNSYDCTPQQAIEYIAALHGLNVEFRRRKRLQLSEEEKQRRRGLIAAMNAAKQAAFTS